VSAVSNSNSFYVPPAAGREVPPQLAFFSPRSSRIKSLPFRFTLLALLFGIELVTISICIDTQGLHGIGGLVGFLFEWSPWMLQGALAFAVAFPVFEYLRPNSVLRHLAAVPVHSPIAWGGLAAHGAILAWFGVLSAWLFYGRLPQTDIEFIAGNWFAFGFLAIVLAAIAFLPWPTWRAILFCSGRTWIFALTVAILACLAGNFGRQLWLPAGKITFGIVKFLLSPFLSGIVANPSTMELGSSKFSVLIAPGCSGFEGAGLMLIFGAAWLVISRREFRFPQAWLLVPAGVAAAYSLNCVRLAVLILIGNAGAPGIALGGFHSQAGWIAFNALALGFAVGARRLPWFAVRRPIPVAPCAVPHAGPDVGGQQISIAGRNPVAVYLAPFLAILAASMVARAGSADFEWLYPVRFLAAAAALWLFRNEYRKLDWRCTWVAPLAGAAVFALWIALDSVGASNSAAAAALGSAAPAARIGWIAVRALAASVTVPIAEELAFRGFLLRRLTAADFESIDPRRVTWIAVIVSSLAFGLMHGGRWFPGALAGAAYALAYRYRARIGDAVMAHAVTNALLAAWVISRGAWGLW
jgi:exosortase E/protease (VPEID-CTERM system)